MLYIYLTMNDFTDKVFHFLSTYLCPGTSETQVFDEQSPSGKDYLAEVKENCLLIFFKKIFVIIIANIMRS